MITIEQAYNKRKFKPKDIGELYFLVDSLSEDSNEAIQLSAKRNKAQSDYMKSPDKEGLDVLQNYLTLYWALDKLKSWRDMHNQQAQGALYALSNNYLNYINNQRIRNLYLTLPHIITEKQLHEYRKMILSYYDKKAKLEKSPKIDYGFMESPELTIQQLYLIMVDEENPERFRFKQIFTQSQFYGIAVIRDIDGIENISPEDKYVNLWFERILSIEPLQELSLESQTQKSLYTTKTTIERSHKTLIAFNLYLTIIEEVYKLDLGYLKQDLRTIESLISYISRLNFELKGLVGHDQEKTQIVEDYLTELTENYKESTKMKAIVKRRVRNIKTLANNNLDVWNDWYIKQNINDIRDTLTPEVTNYE